ncbi:Lipoma HMGIC fusion partner -like protein [Toxocara canis]|uniref:Lipoma HMGIC fusion partner-like protein n=1 Tax=Toxocara canis TaxID=6265 RepID=A0A0B2VUN3_TOXCA|nr:Lipoma HMGIC fusion partner -like protein [Toxocara canis]
MSTGLTPIGYGWAILSTVSTVCVVTGFYIPAWLIGTISVEGRRVYTYFGSFRRCNYPVYDNELNAYRIEEKCGRYVTFGDIPSIHWQICTISIALGCALALLLTFILVPSCCMKDIVTRTSALVIGLMQVVAAVGVSVGCVIYPLGWNIREVKEACGPGADQFLLGECEFGWSYMLMLSGSALLLLCSVLSVKGGRSRHLHEFQTSFDEQALMNSLRLNDNSTHSALPIT